MTDVLRMAATHLLRNKMFYYNLFKQFVIIESKSVPTAGVNITNKRPHFYYNRDFLSRYTPKEYAAIVEHECCHFSFGHMKDFNDRPPEKHVFEDEKEAADHVRKVSKSQAKHKLRNIAMDRSINVYIPSLPNMRILREEIAEKESIICTYKEGETEDKDIVEVAAITEQSFKDLLTRSEYPDNVDDVARYERWEYYYDLLMKCPKIEEQMESIRTMDVHFQSGDEESEASQEGVKNSVIIKSYQDSNKDSVPGHLRQALENAINYYNGKPIPWNRVLRRLIQQAMKTVMKQDVNIRNRHYGSNRSIIPGYYDDPMFKIGVIFDTSGSCIDEKTQGEFWNEVAALHKFGSEVTIYYTDAAVEHVQKVTKSSKLTNYDYEGRGGGGTDLDVGIKQAIDDKHNIVIMLTDCWMNFNLVKGDLRGTKVICASSTEDNIPAHYGPTIRIKK